MQTERKSGAIEAIGGPPSPDEDVRGPFDGDVCDVCNVSDHHDHDHDESNLFLGWLRALPGVGQLLDSDSALRFRGLTRSACCQLRQLVELPRVGRGTGSQAASWRPQSRQDVKGGSRPAANFAGTGGHLSRLITDLGDRRPLWAPPPRLATCDLRLATGHLAGRRNSFVGHFAAVACKVCSKLKSFELLFDDHSQLAATAASATCSPPRPILLPRRRQRSRWMASAAHYCAHLEELRPSASGWPARCQPEAREGASGAGPAALRHPARRGGDDNDDESAAKLRPPRSLQIRRQDVEWSSNVRVAGDEQVVGGGLWIVLHAAAGPRQNYRLGSTCPLGPRRSVARSAGPNPTSGRPLGVFPMSAGPDAYCAIACKKLLNNMSLSSGLRRPSSGCGQSRLRPESVLLKSKVSRPEPSQGHSSDALRPAACQSNPGAELAGHWPAAREPEPEPEPGNLSKEQSGPAARGPKVFASASTFRCRCCHCQCQCPSLAFGPFESELAAGGVARWPPNKLRGLQSEQRKQQQ